MKKSFFALVSSIACASAFSQSSVSIFGGVDVGYQRVSADGGGSVSRLINGGSLTSRIGFRGTEDLGGGLSAGFWIEGGFNGDTGLGIPSNTNNQVTGSAGGGSFTFNRRSTVQISGDFGELRFGRDVVPVFWNQTIFDPFRTQGSGASINLTTGAGLGTSSGLTNPTAGRVSNSIGYFLPKLGGVYGQVLYGFGENASNAPGGTADDGKFLGGRIGYGTDRLNTAIAFTRTTYASGDFTTFNAGLSYDFGSFALMGQLGQDERKLPSFTRQAYWLLGTTIPMGNGYIRASYANADVCSSADDGTLLAIGYVYTLSKRTSIYTALARIDNKGLGTKFNQGIAVTQRGGSSTAFDVGLRHDF